MFEKSHELQGVLTNVKYSTQVLDQNQIQIINSDLVSLNSVGDVRLMVEKGVLGLVVIQNRVDALKYTLIGFNKREIGG